MKDKKQMDVLLVARPDHSMKIYRELLNHNELNFHFITFKVVRDFVKKIIPYKKLQTVSRYCTIAIKPTIIQVCKKTFYFKFAQKWKIDDFLSPYVKRKLDTHKFKLIHYWPEYSSSVINEFLKKEHSDTIVLADMYMPNPAAIIDEMTPVFEKYNLPTDNSWLVEYAKKTKDHFRYVTDIMVASSYVQRTMEQTFPDKRYHIVSYGIDVSPTYKKKIVPKRVSKFVYVGRVSVEKGSDLILEWFSQHPDKEIHLYGGLWDSQKFIFEKYWKYENIHYHGAVSKDELRTSIPKCDVGIHMSRFDAYSLAVGEMIGCGLPVIVSENTGNCDDILSNKLGIVSKLDYDSLDKSICTISDLSSYSSFIDNIDTYINSPRESYGQSIIALYKRLLNYD